MALKQGTTIWFSGCKGEILEASDTELTVRVEMSTGEKVTFEHVPPGMVSESSPGDWYI